MPRAMREGFTTGTAAAAAAKAAAMRLLTGALPDRADTPLPGGGRLAAPVAGCEAGPDWAMAWVVKDGGDDPDATHGAHIQSRVTLDPGGEPGHVDVDGGPGVGRVTLPGLPVAVGQAAINPAPRAQIAEAVAEALAQAGFTGSARVVVSVPEGEALARRTMNARLGVLGGISILGTTGTVRPFSHEAWACCVQRSLDVIRAQGLDQVALSTGRRAEKLLRRELPSLPETAFIQAADLFSLALREAASRGFRRAVWGCFPGKLVKMAQGCENTHARHSAIDFDLLARWCAEAGAAPDVCRAAAGSVTVRGVMELLAQDAARPRLMARLAALARDAGRAAAGGELAVGVVVFDPDGSVLAAV